MDLFFSMLMEVLVTNKGVILNNQQLNTLDVRLAKPTRRLTSLVNKHSANIINNV